MIYPYIFRLIYPCVKTSLYLDIRAVAFFAPKPLSPLPGFLFFPLYFQFAGILMQVVACTLRSTFAMLHTLKKNNLAADHGGSWLQAIDVAPCVLA